MKLTESDIQHAIGQSLRLTNICIPNVLMRGGRYEADLVYFNLKSKLLNEVEIKLSITDFRNDFKKKYYHDSEDIAYLHYAMPKWLYEDYQSEIENSLGNAGLIVFDPVIGIKFVKRARKRKHVIPLSEHQILQYMRLGCMKWIKT